MGSLALSFTHPKAVRKVMADKTASVVTYTMHHPMHTWDGVSHDVNSAIRYDDESKKIESVAVSIRVASFNSDNANRDSHALEVLESLKYPNVTFVSQTMQIANDGTVAIQGNLTFHGVTKPITVQATRKYESTTLTVDGGFDVSLTDYGVVRPSLLGMKTDDTMKMKFMIVFKL